MVIKPWGYGIWEGIQRQLDAKFKATGHVNAYFPLLIPLSYLEKEAQHAEGFATECAVVTHHRLELGPDGRLPAAGPLEEPLIVRPSSDTMSGDMFAKWIHSYRDLPLKINHWANVVRWEMRPRLFLRTTEFLWQEGHTVHATKEEAWEETRMMLDVYARFAEDYMAIPVIKGEKSVGERFPGADSTLTIEAMMQDRKALQAGTSHFLGQNFSRAQEIKFQDQNGREVYAWTTSWGMSTRMIGALIMTHSDDDGLVLPPKIATKQIVIQPIYRNDEERSAVLEYCQNLRHELAAVQYDGRGLVVFIDDREMRGGEKKWYHVKRGVPIRLEIGPRDVAADKVFAARRDQGKAEGIDRREFVSRVVGILDEMQQNLLDRARLFREQHTRTFTDFEEFRKFFTPANEEEPEIHGGFARAHFVDTPEISERLKEFKVTVRCMPLEDQPGAGRCLFTGQPTERVAIFAKSY
ncbi:MAG: aminoacyl--tRNA ligase-related protein, partial [Planctomycetota bacterium]